MSLTIPEAPPLGIVGTTRSAPTLRVIRSTHAEGAGTFTSTSTAPAQAATPFSREALFDHFITSLADLMVARRDSDFSAPMAGSEKELAIASAMLVYALLSDDGPTPQTSEGPEGGWAIEWLVDGNSLTLHVVSTSDIRMWADAASGGEIFDFEFNSNWTREDEALRLGRAFLAAMSPKIRNRLPLRT